ncbi:MAG: hypothetical protein V4498_06750 [candidate division FCPU426 bacterium]
MDLTKAKLWFVALSMIALVLFAASILREEDREWKKWQAEYFAMEAERGIDRDYTVKIRQIWNPQMGRTDRCITCHLGMEDVDVSNPYAKNPFKSHPKVDMIKKHMPGTIGCTICHDGQGLATDTTAAHGRVHAWDYPMKEKIGGVDFVESSCTKCHAYDALPEGTEVLVAGRALVQKYGCMGCHSSKELGQTIGIMCPDLTGIGSKTESQFANTHLFEHLEDHSTDGHYITKYEWLYQHFLDPQKITPIDPKAPPGTGVMPNFHMTETNARILTAFVMSLRDPAVENIPSNWIAKGKGSYTVVTKD